METRVENFLLPALTLENRTDNLYEVFNADREKIARITQELYEAHDEISSLINAIWESKDLTINEKALAIFLTGQYLQHIKNAFHVMSILSGKGVS